MVRPSVLVALLLLCLSASAAKDKKSKWHDLAAVEDVEGMKELAKKKGKARGDIDEVGVGGATPLMYAVLTGKVKSVETLLDLGADIEIPEKDGYTAVHAAAFQGRPEILKVLLAHGLDAREIHADGYEPIHRACWGTDEGHTGALKVLLEYGVPYNARAVNGKTPMDLLMLKQKHPSFLLLREYEAIEKEAEKAEKARKQAKTEEL
ncbi:Delta-latroinsectotoxin-Lt1a [Diplonema papillatum]|nr:Delta-latroinsectotoxin-Lt1a [Diplonema papillatum]